MSIKALIVDDSATGRTYIQKALVLSGCQETGIKQAKNGMEAIELLKNESFDVMFLDINMPVMNGIEVVEKMSLSGAIEKTVVVITSSEGNKDRIEYLLKKGVRKFLRKPFTPELCKEIFDLASGKA